MTLSEQRARVGARNQSATSAAASTTKNQPAPKQTDEALPIRRAPAGAIDLLNTRRNQTTAAARAQADAEEDDVQYNDAWPGRLPSSARRYSTLAPRVQPLPSGEYLINGRRVIVDAPYVIPNRRSATSNTTTSGNRITGQARTPYIAEEEPRSRGRRLRPHWLLILGVGMLLTLSAWYGLVQLGNWWTIHQQDVTFGRPRTYQFDAVLGNGDSAQMPTHFICLNLNRHVEVYEEPAGDASKTVIYDGPVLFGDGQDLTPVLGRVATINGQRVLILYIQDQTIVYFYSGGKFVLATQQQLATIHQLPPPPNP